MAKPLNQLLEKLNPDVVKAAEQRAKKEIQELKKQTRTPIIEPPPESSLTCPASAGQIVSGKV